jgi:hypothetical protein
MALMPERAFDPSRPVVARRFFVAAGRHFNPGDSFDWTRLAVDQRRVRQMFEAGKLEHTPAEPVAVITNEIADEDIHRIAVTAAAAIEDDNLEGMRMPELREIAEREGAPTRVSRSEQVEAIRATRRAAKAV